jgi:hypothetical protein
MPYSASMAALVAGLMMPPTSPPAVVPYKADPPPRVTSVVTVDTKPAGSQARLWLYGGFTALQVGDIVTTTVNLRNGASEANPLLGSSASSPTKLSVIKALATTATLWAAESMWRSGEKKGAIATIVVATAIAAGVFVKNLHTYQQLQVK